MDAQVARLHDGRGGSPGHRPGFVFGDALLNRDEREKAYSDYERDLTAAYKNSRNDRLIVDLMAATLRQIGAATATANMTCPIAIVWVRCAITRQGAFCSIATPKKARN
jgi:hypothetical protein